jgi:hypothetical protein
LSRYAFSGKQYSLKKKKITKKCGLEQLRATNKMAFLYIFDLFIFAIIAVPFATCVHVRGPLLADASAQSLSSDFCFFALAVLVCFVSMELIVAKHGSVWRL